MSKADENYEWFKDNLHELLKGYEGLYVIIKDKHIEGAYLTFNEAWDYASQTGNAGEYLIQLCAMADDGDAAMPTFFSNLVKFHE